MNQKEAADIINKQPPVLSEKDFYPPQDNRTYGLYGNGLDKIISYRQEFFGVFQNDE